MAREIRREGEVAPGIAPAPGGDDYKDKLLKLIPAEVVALYLTLDGVISSAAKGSTLETALWVAFGVGLAGTPLYLTRVAGVSNALQLAISTVSFVVWIFALGGPFALADWYTSWIAASVLAVFTFSVPIILGRK